MPVEPIVGPAASIDDLAEELAEELAKRKAAEALVAELRFAVEAEKTERQQAVDLASREVAEAKRVSLQQLERANAAKLESWRAQALAASLREMLRSAHVAMQTWFSSEYAEHDLSRHVAAVLRDAERVPLDASCFCPSGYTGVCVACKVRMYDAYLEQAVTERKRAEVAEARAASLRAGLERLIAGRPLGSGMTDVTVTKADLEELVQDDAARGTFDQAVLRALLARLVQRLESHRDVGSCRFDARDKTALKDARAALETKP